MKNVLHRTKVAFQKRVKITKILENSEDKECITRICKTFVYVLNVVVDDSQKLPEPQIKIKKSFNSKTREEQFSFRIKGAIYVNHNRRLVRVNYSHTLRIYLKWKNKTISPKKSVTVA